MNTNIMLLSETDKYKRACYGVYINGEHVGQIEHVKPKNYPPYYDFRSDENIDMYARGLRTLIALKREIINEYKKAVNNGKIKKAQNGARFDVKYLPHGDINDFFPTPKSICGQMIGCVNWSKVKTVLEPSAGKGDICDAIADYMKHRNYGNKIDIDCIELDENLRFVLKGKNYRVVYDDFMTYQTNKKYDLIIMNPPFSNGDEHLMRAIEMQEQTGGQIVCLLNSETLLNPYTNLRKLLLKKIKEHAAIVHYLKSPFKKAERRTNVNVALVCFNIPSVVRESEIFKRMKKAKDLEYTREQSAEVAPGDRIEALVRSYEIESSASIAFLQEWDALRPNILNGSETYSRPSIGITISGHEIREGLDAEAINNYLRSVRLKYWRKLLELPEICAQMTTAIRNSFEAKINDMENYEFSMFNIQEVIWDIHAQLQTGVEDEIVKLFEKLSNEHSYYENSGNDNIHYYNGWKTNKAHKVNYKVIIPAYGSFARGYKYDKYNRLVEKTNDFIDSRSCYATLVDLEKTLDYLDGKDPNRIRCNLANRLHFAAERGETRNIDCTYFYVTFYKKGTCHITFREDAKILIDRLNIHVGKNKNWLPPNYGKTAYKNLTEEERVVVDAFDGSEENYNKVFANQNQYLIESKDLLMLSSSKNTTLFA